METVTDVLGLCVTDVRVIPGRIVGGQTAKTLITDVGEMSVILMNGTKTKDRK